MGRRRKAVAAGATIGLLALPATSGAHHDYTPPLRPVSEALQGGPQSEDQAQIESPSPPQLWISGAARRVGRHGRVVLPVRCIARDAGSCGFSLRLSQASGATMTRLHTDGDCIQRARLRLPGALLRALRRRGRLSLRAAVAAVDDAGARATFSRRLKIRG